MIDRLFANFDVEFIDFVIAQGPPVDVGFKAKYTWTLPLVAAWIELEFDVAYSPAGFSKMLKRLGFSYPKATYTLERADLEKQREFLEETFPAYQALQYNWFLKGQERKIPTYGRHEGAKLFAAIHYATGHIINREEEMADAQAFQRFLQDLLAAYPDVKIAILLFSNEFNCRFMVDQFVVRIHALHPPLKCTHLHFLTAQVLHLLKDRCHLLVHQFFAKI
ncbi:winged helix-turn-helix domain-containing protein [Solibacillus silvestris]|uniref:winged helix-turn-helix domain-containing protein n=1 Tax=Solibacillus silvestris TaxID=76853 RepID=UPI003F7EB92E